MTRFVEWIQGFALALGGPGLFVIAFLDSSFLSFPEINDLLIIWLTTQHPERMPYYATLATLGSISGCYALFLISRKGGEKFLRKRFHERHVDRALEVVKKHGILSVLVPSLLPPPAPFKIFVLASGVARVSTRDFLIAVGIGRGTRYFGEGLLALWYGERAANFLKENARTVGVVAAIAVLILGLAWIWWRRRREKTSSPGAAN